MPDSARRGDESTWLTDWGVTDPGGPADFDGAGNVSAPDLLALLANWGPCPCSWPARLRVFACGKDLTCVAGSPVAQSGRSAWSLSPRIGQTKSQRCNGTLWDVAYTAEHRRNEQQLRYDQ
ncbi:MAG: hypothetical protein V3T53_05600 [Phycisphaerales bacterium]